MFLNIQNHRLRDIMMDEIFFSRRSENRGFKEFIKLGSRPAPQEFAIRDTDIESSTCNET